MVTFKEIDKMKRDAIVFLFFGLFGPFILLAGTIDPKEQYAHGMIFLLNRDTIEAYIKVEKIVKMQEQIEFIDTAGFEYSVKPSQAAGFCLLFPEDTMVFESRDDLVNAIFKSKKEPYSFVLRLKEGNMPLYYFYEEKLEMSGVDQILVEKPRYLALFRNVLHPIRRKYFKNDVRKIYLLMRREGFGNEIDELMNDVEKNKYSYEETPKTISRIDAILSSKKSMNSPFGK